MSRCAKYLELPESEISRDFIGNEFVNTAIAFAVVESLLVILRYYARYVGRRPLGVDDILLPFALLFAFAQEGIAIAMVKVGGVGHRLEYNCYFQPSVLVTFAKLQISNILSLALAIALAKIVILNLFLRIFHQKPYRIATFIVMGIQVAAMLVVVIVGVTQCTPLAYVWEPQKHPKGHCIDKNTFWRWGNFPQLVTDVAILVLPIPALWQLKLSTKDKIGVIVTFCTGGIGLVTAIVRFTMYFMIDGQTDAGWEAVPLGSVSIAETGVYVIAACLPMYRSLLKTAVERVGTTFGSTRKTQTGYSYGSGSHSTELKSLGKSEKGFSRLDEEKSRTTTTVTQYRLGSESSDEQLVPSGLKDIQIQRTFDVSSQRK